MASNGSIEQTARFGYVRLSWVVESQSIETNTSSLTYTLSIYRTSNITSNINKNYSISINGTVFSGTDNIGGTGTKILASGTTQVAHNADGTKTIAISFSQEINITWSGTHIGTLSASANMSLSTIPRPTTPTLSSTTLTMGSPVTVNLPRASSAFTHTLKILFGGTTRTIATSLGTSYSWTPPTDVLAPAIPNATSGSGTLICETYNGTTLLGTRTLAVTLAVPVSVIPVFGATPITATETIAGLSSKFGAFVQNVSKIAVGVSASGIYGSTISAYSITLDGMTYSGASFTSGKITNSGTLPVVATITDSRGRKNTSTLNIYVLQYAVPTISRFLVYRANTDGTQNPDSTKVRADFKFTVSAINDLNDKYYEIVYRETGTSAWGAVTSGNLYSFDGHIISSDLFNVDKTYEVALNVYDYVTSATAKLEIPTAFTLIDFRSTGKGLAFGKVSQEDKLEVAMTSEFSAWADFNGGLRAAQQLRLAPTLLNSWVNYNAGYEVATYWMDSCYNVHVCGMIKGGATADGTIIFNLPEGYRPRLAEKFFVCSVNGICILDLYTTGNLAIRTGANSGWISLSGITFRSVWA